MKTRNYFVKNGYSDNESKKLALFSRIRHERQVLSKRFKVLNDKGILNLNDNEASELIANLNRQNTLYRRMRLVWNY